MRLEVPLPFVDLSDKAGNGPFQVGMLRVIGTVSHDVLPHQLVIKLQLRERLLLLTEVPLVSLYAFLLLLDHVCYLCILFLNIHKVLVKVEARLDRGSALIPNLSEARERIRDTMATLIRTLGPFLGFVRAQII